jgi:hypothetical protein
MESVEKRSQAITATSLSCILITGSHIQGTNGWYCQWTGPHLLNIQTQQDQTRQL